MPRAAAAAKKTPPMDAVRPIAPEVDEEDEAAADEVALPEAAEPVAVPVDEADEPPSVGVADVAG